MAFLLARTGTDKGVRFEIGKDEITLGRASDNDVVLQGDSVSGHHARIWRTDDGFRLADLGSTNGSAVDGEPVVRECPLGSGAVIMLGHEELVFDPDEPAYTATVRIRTGEAGVAPAGFGSASPFGSRPDFRPLWTALIVLAGLAAVGGVLYLLYLFRDIG